MPWILWVVLCFQRPSEESNNLNRRGLEAVRQDALAREAIRRSMEPDKVGAASAGTA